MLGYSTYVSPPLLPEAAGPQVALQGEKAEASIEITKSRATVPLVLSYHGSLVYRPILFRLGA